MCRSKLLRQLAALVALAGVLTGGLRPLVAHGMVAKPGLPVVICTATGFHVVAGGDPAYPVPADFPGTKSRCTLCCSPPPVAMPATAPRLPTYLAIVLPAEPPRREIVFREAPRRLLPPSQAPPARVET